RDHVGYADHEPQRLPGRPPLERLLKLLAERNDLVGIAKRDPAAVGQHEVAATADQQLLAEDFFEPMDLAADRRVCEAKLLAGLRDASVLRDHPKVQEMMVIEPLHRESTMSCFSKLFGNHSVFCCSHQLLE